MSEQNNLGARFFLGRKNAILICIEPAKDRTVGFSAMAVFKNADIGTGWEDLANSLSRLNYAVVGIVVSDEAAYESDYDVFRSGIGCGCA